METTKNNLPEDIKHFLNELSEYLDTKLLYYGSVQRDDYIPGKSDIDIDIFTDNIASTLIKMQHFLHIDKSDFKKIIWTTDDNVILYGRKLKFKHKTLNVEIEFSIYDDKLKQHVVNSHVSKFVLPLYITILLSIIKFFHYTIYILPKHEYSVLKRYIMNYCMGEKDTKFVVFD